MNNKFILRNTIISVGDDSFSDLKEFLESSKPTKTFILVDQNTKKYCLPRILSLVSSLKSACVLELNGCAEHSGNIELLKSMNMVNDICIKLLNYNIDRDSLIINLGGGVICDLGGFVASIIKRGVKFINIPTTLMAQVDAAIGGKVAVNLKNHKNQVGLFVDPVLIIVCPFFNRSISNFNFVCAFSEVLKYGLIYDVKFWKQIVYDHDLVFKNQIIDQASELTELISKCIQIKIEIVNSDYYDIGPRRKLNFGHSIAHAFESYVLEHVDLDGLGNAVHHGLALSLGLVCETYISYRKFNFPKMILNDIALKIEQVFPPIDYDLIKFKKLVIGYLKSDKKNLNGQYQFSLIKEIGHPIVNCSVSESEIIDSIDYYINKMWK